MQRQLAVAVGGEVDAVHRDAQLAIIVDLAVRHQRRGAGEERLVAGHQVDDRQPVVQQRDAADARRGRCRRGRGGAACRSAAPPRPAPAAPRWARERGRRCRTFRLPHANGPSDAGATPVGRARPGARLNPCSPQICRMAQRDARRGPGLSHLAEDVSGGRAGPSGAGSRASAGYVRASVRGRVRAVWQGASAWYVCPVVFGRLADRPARTSCPLSGTLRKSACDPERSLARIESTALRCIAVIRQSRQRSDSVWGTEPAPLTRSVHGHADERPARAPCQICIDSGPVGCA